MEHFNKSNQELATREIKRDRGYPQKKFDSETSRHSHISRDRRDDRSKKRRTRSRSSSSSSSGGEKTSSKMEIAKIPPPPMISKISMNLKPLKSTSGVQLKLNAAVKKPLAKQTVASAFNLDDSEDDEEMPAECRMRMRNVGKNTPTSSGPNSFGKHGKLGFVDSKKIFEKKMQQMLKDIDSE